MTLKFPFSRFKISDHSMEPVYLEGDRVVTFNWGKYKRADITVFRVFTSLRVPPFQKMAGRDNLIMRLLHGVYSDLMRFFRFAQNDKGRVRNDKKVYMIKRIDKIQGGKIFVSGDNKKMTSKIGPIKQDQIIGKVIWKY